MVLLDLDDDETYLTPFDAAKRLNIPLAKLMQYVENGDIEAQYMAHDQRKPYFLEEDVDELLEVMTERRQERAEKYQDRLTERDEKALVRTQENAELTLERVRNRQLSLSELVQAHRERRLEALEEKARANLMMVGLGGAICVFLAYQLKKKQENAQESQNQALSQNSQQYGDSSSPEGNKET